MLLSGSGPGPGGGGGAGSPRPSGDEKAPFCLSSELSANCQLCEYPYLEPVTNDCFRLRLCNMQSVGNKEDILDHGFSQFRFDILAMTETWMTSDSFPTDTTKQDFRDCVFYGKHRQSDYRCLSVCVLSQILVIFRKGICTGVRHMLTGVLIKGSIICCFSPK